MKFFSRTILLVVTISCSSPKNKDVTTDTRSTSLTIDYATKFNIKEDEVKVMEPWPGAAQPESYRLGKVPQRVIATSTSHLPYLEMLGVDHTLVGFPNTGYISSEKIRSRVEKGEITDLGPDGNLNIEVLLSLQPDVVFAYDTGHESAFLDKVTESGIPVIYNSDYLETSALGRAEWIKFFGAFYHQEKKADSIFQQIVNRYDSLKDLTRSLTQRPTVINGIMYGEVWFLPAGNNWSARFYKDAGAEYLWADAPGSGWLELSFESVIDKGQSADYWIGTGSFESRTELAGNDSRYAQFKAFQNKKVYNYSKRKSPAGGYDFFESGYSRPDLVLADLISIFHPEILSGYQTYYFERVP